MIITNNTNEIVYCYLQQKDNLLQIGLLYPNESIQRDLRKGFIHFKLTQMIHDMIVPSKTFSIKEIKGINQVCLTVH